MAAALKTLQRKYVKIKGATDLCINDFVMNVTKVSAKEVVDHGKIFFSNC